MYENFLKNISRTFKNTIKHRMTFYHVCNKVFLYFKSVMRTCSIVQITRFIPKFSHFTEECVLKKLIPQTSLEYYNYFSFHLFKILLIIILRSDWLRTITKTTKTAKIKQITTEQKEYKLPLGKNNCIQAPNETANNRQIKLRKNCFIIFLTGIATIL